MPRGMGVPPMSEGTCAKTKDRRLHHMGDEKVAFIGVRGGKGIRSEKTVDSPAAFKGYDDPAWSNAREQVIPCGRDVMLLKSAKVQIPDKFSPQSASPCDAGQETQQRGQYQNHRQSDARRFQGGAFVELCLIRLPKPGGQREAGECASAEKSQGKSLPTKALVQIDQLALDCSPDKARDQENDQHQDSCE